MYLTHHMKTPYRIVWSYGLVFIGVVGLAASTAKANVYTNREVTVEGYWSGSLYDAFLSTPPVMPTEGAVGYGTLMEQPKITFTPLMQIQILDQYDPFQYKVVRESGYPLRETVDITLKSAGRISQNTWQAIRVGGSDIFTWQLTTNAPTFLSSFDFNYVRTTTTDQYKLDPVPEPAAAAVFAVGMASFLWLRRKRVSGGTPS